MNEQTINERPVWSSWRDVPAVVLHRTHLRRTASVAIVVGTVLFLINQLDVVLAGGVTLRVAAKIGITYLVPFCVSNYGLLVGRRASR